MPDHKNHVVYFNNWFCSVDLQVELAKKGILSLGTVRENRLRNCPLPNDNDLKKGGRGSFEEMETNVKRVTLRAVKCHDNRAVTLLSTFSGAEPLGVVQRYNRKEKLNVETACPPIVPIYNRRMGGVDLLDSLIAFYLTVIRSKKLVPQNILSHAGPSMCFHLVDVPEGRQYSKHPEEAAAVPFAVQVRSISSSLCQDGKEPKESKRGQKMLSSIENVPQEQKKLDPAASAPETDFRLYRVRRFPMHNVIKRRCKRQGCTGIVRIKCRKCQVYLCLSEKKDCFF